MPGNPQLDGQFAGDDSRAHSGMAIALEPSLREACGGRLGEIEWFKAAWQRGGASTGFSMFRLRDDEPSVPVLVKFPVGPSERDWTASLGCVDPIDCAEAMRMSTPRVFAHGDKVGEYDIAWIVTERLAGDHLPRHMDEALVTELMSRVLGFHISAAACKPVAGKAKSPDWAMLLERGRHLTVEHALPEFHEWHDIIRRVQRNLPWLTSRWEQRTIDTWCHGDVHPGNVLRRVMPGASLAHAGSGPCVLIDLALVHVGHWMEDALYLERQYWGHEDWIGHAKPLTILARLRREAGLPTESAYAELANVRRVLMAACAPAMIGTEGGNQKYLHSALEHAKMLLPMVLH